MAERQTYDWGGGTLTPEQVAQIAYQVGFHGAELAGIVAIGERESGYQPGIHGSDQPQDSVSGDRGLFQINSTHDDNLMRAGIIDSPEDLFDPVINARAAYYLSGNGSPSGIQQLWQAGPGGWQQGGDPYYGTDRAAAAAAVQNASQQGLLGQDWGGEPTPSDEQRQPMTPEEREELETNRKLGNMGHPDYRKFATAPRKQVTARQAVIERLLDEDEEDDPEQWAATARRLGNQGFRRFGTFSSLGEDNLDQAQVERHRQQLGNLGMERFNKAATAPERAQNLRAKAIRELLGPGKHEGKEWLSAAQKLGNRGMQRFEGYSTLPEKKLERRQEGYKEKMEGQKVMTNLLADLGIDYANAPRPSASLLAYLQNVGLDIDQAEQMQRRGVQRIRSTAQENRSDLLTTQGRAKRSLTSDLANRGVLSSGEANRRYTEHAIDTAEGISDINRARSQGVRDTRFGFGSEIEQIRADAIQHVAQEEENQATTRATQRATTRQYRNQRRLAQKLARRQRRVTNRALQDQIDAINSYADRGIPVQ